MAHRAGSPYNEYSYDDIDRLTTVAYHNSDAEGFVMDDLGNRTGDQTLRGEGTVNFAVDPLTNRYTAVAGHPLAYDDAGNLTQNKDGYHYVYDCENRIVEVRNSSNALVAEFDYDTQGRRIRVYDAVADSTTLYYYSDNWQVLSTYVGGSLDKSFVFGNYIDEVLLMNDGTDDYFYLHDHLYSPVGLLDGDGDVLERYEYDAYGSVQILTSNFSPLTSSQYGNPYYFTGRELDILDAGALRLMYYRARAFDPVIGRFMQRDPLDNVDGMNLYEYVNSNPIVNSDPLGLYTVIGPGIPPGSPIMPPPPPNRERVLKNFMEWYEKEKAKGDWWKDLPKCPRKLCMKNGKPQKPTGVEGEKWKQPGKPKGAEERLHPGIKFSMRSISINGHSNQCTYDENGNLELENPKAGTVDWSAPISLAHVLDDVYPIHDAVFLDYGIEMALMSGPKTPSPPKQYMDMYYEVRPLFAESDSEGTEERCCP